ncbi:sugar transferase [Virgibacillus phasianinus]|uniref:Sugar transferase n=1 Tax=Virgibacillus phasianinus TaxID=2017483 RepID=A0A220U7K4_9BACI|nr:sugar transferase [Virgibacillus phasianinus]ASK63723.1 sugar transferase [Virgibacillus phasianinus]
MKRVMDTIISLMLLLVFSPIMIAIAVAIQMNMGAPIIFKQQRPGLFGKPFYLYKFRSMINTTDNQSDLMRLTTLGRLLRKYSLDELPQLINVVKGDMSLVGPRPLLMEYLPLYTKEQGLRHHVRPGITGWAQVNGRNAITWSAKFNLDIWYVKNRSLPLDCKILLYTIAKVLKKEGINHDESVSMEKFKGSNEVI